MSNMIAAKKNKLLLLSGIVLVQLMLASSLAWAQNNSVSGTVTDSETGETLPGVNVLVKGTTTGTSTDTEGNYSLNAPSLTDTLVFSYIGFETQEIPINSRTTVNIEMSSQTLTGEELVVVGYGEQRGEDVTGSVSSVSMNNVDTQPVTSADQQLTGQISGVQVNTTNGIPGGGPQIRIRGVGAIGAGSQPLYVVDGFPLPSASSQISNPLNDIPPNNIESISVLKDASATAIYGSRGANGVVLITTKSGQAGETQIQISGYTGVQTIPESQKPNLLNAQQYARFQKERIEDQIRYEENREPTESDIPEEYQDPEQYGEGTNWYDAVTRIAPTRNLTVNVSGGNEDVRAFTSAGYLGQKGVVYGSDFNRFSLRANIDATLSSKLNVGLNIAPTYSLREQVSVGGAGRGDAIGNAVVASPIPPVYNDDGTFNVMISSPGSFDYPNPLQQLKQTDADSRNGRFLANAFGEYEIADGLALKNTINIDWNDIRSERYNPSTLGALNVFPPTVPSSSLNEFSYIDWLNETTMRYRTDWTSHSIEALAGITFQKHSSNYANISGQDFPMNDEIQYLNAATRLLGGSGAEDWSLISYLARINYSYNDTYLVTATIRRDGSSRFGRESRWGVFPSAAIGWRVSNESFMDDISWLQDLKVRLSYGVTGNFEIGNYPYVGQIVSSSYNFGGTLAPGNILSSLGNPNLGWEQTEEVNLGIDLSILQGRVNFTADIYKRNTKDLLLNVEIPGSSGFTSVTENRGNLENRGIELSLQTANISSPDFSWNSNFNISFNRNEILELGRSDAPILSGRSGEGNPTNITRIGSPVGLFYGYVSEGVYVDQDDVDNSATFPGAIPGNVKYRDINGDGNITPVDDFAVIGNPYPDFTFGLTNTLGYKNFNLKVLLSGSYGGEIMEASNEYLHNIDGVFNVTEDVLDQWESPDDIGSGIVPTTAGTGRSRVLYRDVNSTWVKDNSYIWFKNITLGYDLPQTWVGQFMQSANVYLSVQNPFLFSAYDGNPEVSTYNDPEYSGILTPGIDYTSYPVPRIYTVGARISF